MVRTAAGAEQDGVMSLPREPFHVWPADPFEPTLEIPAQVAESLATAVPDEVTERLPLMMDKPRLLNPKTRRRAPT